MNRLKEFAKALNKAAPKGEFLAFINGDEAEMLENAGGSGLLTKFGIPSYRVGGQSGREYGGGGLGGGNRGGGSNNDGADRDGGSSARERAAQQARERAAQQRAAQKAAQERAARDRQREQYAAARTQTPRTKTVNVPDRDDAPFEIIGGQRVAVGDPRSAELSNVKDTRSPIEKTFSSIVDFYKKGGFLGNILSGVSNISSNIQKKALEFGLNTKINRLVNKKGSTPRENNIIYNRELTDLRNDLDAVRSGEFGQREYTEKYGSGDATNPLDASFNPNALSDSERDNLSNLFASEAAVALSGGTPQNSVVNQYFKSINNANLGVSSAYMDTYNQAKDRMAKSLNLTPTNEQFGYNPNAFSNYSMSMTSDNPFFEELQNQGII